MNTAELLHEQAAGLSYTCTTLELGTWKPIIHTANYHSTQVQSTKYYSVVVVHTVRIRAVPFILYHTSYRTVLIIHHEQQKQHR
jgi:hypothetical protein